MSELKPCPFCGGKADFTVTGDRYPFRVKCGKCRAEAGGTAFDNDEFNAECWNRRASPWIPCKDRLPEIPKGRFAVQVDAWYWADGPSGKEKEVHVMMFRNEVFFEGIWSEANGHEWIESFYPVEGWMYRPVPPDKDEA